MRGLLTGLLLATTAATAMALTPDSLTFDAQLRTRAEYRNGALYPLYDDESAATFVNQRTRLSVQYDHDLLTVRASAQHTGVWGQDPQVDKKGRLALNEAWAKLRFGEDFFVQLGRQQLSYDDERLLGASDWNVVGAWHDALRVGYEQGRHKAHVIVALNQNDEQFRQVYYDATAGQPYKSMQALWYHLDAGQLLPAPVEVSLMFINLGRENGTLQPNKSDIKYMQTFGGYASIIPFDQLKITGTAYLQRGNATKARMAALEATYILTPEWKVSAGYDYLSGDNNSDDTNSAFTPLYGTHHKFYGAMDYFYATSLSAQVKPIGLQDLHVSLTTTALPRTSVQADYHYFATGTHVDGAFLGLGHEVDTKLSFDLMNHVSLSAGYSFMLGQHTMDIIKGGNHSRWQDWGWVQMNVTL